MCCRDKLVFCFTFANVISVETNEEFLFLFRKYLPQLRTGKGFFYIHFILCMCCPRFLFSFRSVQHKVDLRLSGIFNLFHFRYRGFILFLTFLFYTAYHLSRKPISIVKVTEAVNFFLFFFLLHLQHLQDQMLSERFLSELPLLQPGTARAPQRDNKAFKYTFTC